MIRIGIGYDSHRLTQGRRLVLSGMEIPHTKGLAGHSDGDALLHAIGDAILGAVGAGDIGTQFPDDDPAYKDISSLILLEKIREIAEKKGYAIQNVDTTVILEKPKLKVYRDSMIEKISTILLVPARDVSIKAKTNEGMGFIGREEGMAAMAVVTVRQQVAP